jgi:hypothetical protein
MVGYSLEEENMSMMMIMVGYSPISLFVYFDTVVRLNTLIKIHIISLISPLRYNEFKNFISRSNTSPVWHKSYLK